MGRLTWDSGPVYFAAAMGVLALGWYVLRARWWERLAGWSQVPLLTALVLALMPAVLHNLFGLSLANRGFQIYYRCDIWAIGLSLAWWVFVFRRIQRQGRERRDKPR